MSTRHYFRDLPSIGSFDEAANSASHVDLPDDWWVIVADVQDSTKAIAAGRYKEVNTIGAATVIAVLNVDRATQIPYVFGGDGASIAVPPEMEQGARRALLGAQELAETAFRLTLRIGMVRVADLTARNDWVRVAKLKVSEHLSQTLLSGRGWERAEEWLKSGNSRELLAVRNRPDLTADADFEGLECRWQPVKATSDFKLSLVVLSMAATPSEHIATYEAVLNKISEVYGETSDYHPLRSQSLKLMFNLRSLRREIVLRTRGQSNLAKIRYTVDLLAKIALGRLIFRFNIDTKRIKWTRYKEELINHTDFRKFDGALKMVIDSSAAQRAEFEAFLEEQFQKGRLIYGTHTSRHALLTCLVFSYSGKHSHFVDGSDGGYAMAAAALKTRMREYKTRLYAPAPAALAS
jgi:hypothetical protein